MRCCVKSDTMSLMNDTELRGILRDDVRQIHLAVQELQLELTRTMMSAVKGGVSIEEVCSLVGISRSTFFRRSNSLRVRKLFG